MKNEATDVATLLRNLIQTEITTIASIDGAMETQDEPDYTVLYQSAKTGKQANAEQLLTILRMQGERQTQRGKAMKPMLKLQTKTVQRFSTSATLRAQETLVAGYENAVGETYGVARKAVEKCLERAKKQRFVLIAHLAVRDRRAEHLDALIYPLESHFAHDEARACMRCLFDRPGVLPAIERRARHPYTYICSACHDEVLLTFPPDLLEQSARWPERARHNRVAEKALGRPSKLKAEKEILPKLAGLPITRETPAAKRKSKAAVAKPRYRVVTEIAPTLEVGPGDELETAYTDAILSYRSARKNW